MWDTTPAPQRFDEAERWLRARVPVAASEWRVLSAAARRRAFSVAQVAQADVVAGVLESLALAVEGGMDFAEWKVRAQDKLLKAWQGSTLNPAWRLETIFRTNVQGAYAAGRFKQMSDPDVLKARPFWQFDALIDANTSAICRSLDGTVRPASDPYWNTRYPPLHFNCRSGVRSLTRRQAAAKGVTADPPQTNAANGFDNKPSLEDFEPSLEHYPEDLKFLVRRKLGAP